MERQTLNHCTTRGVPALSLSLFFLALSFLTKTALEK